MPALCKELWTQSYFVPPIFVPPHPALDVTFLTANCRTGVPCVNKWVNKRLSPSRGRRVALGRERTKEVYSNAVFTIWVHAGLAQNPPWKGRSTNGSFSDNVDSISYAFEPWKTDFRKTGLCWKPVTAVEALCFALLLLHLHPGAILLVLPSRRWGPAGCDLPTADGTTGWPATVADASSPGLKPTACEDWIKTMSWLIRLVGVGNRWAGWISGRWQKEKLC